MIALSRRPPVSPMALLAAVSSERRDHARRAQIVSRVRAEFDEMPCLRLTVPQAQRLFGLRADVCARVLTALTAERVLCLGSDGRYSARASSA